MSLYDQIPEVMERFDFQKVHRVMEFLDWRWTSYGAVPPLSALESTAYQLLNDAVREYLADPHPSGMSVSTGGFTAEVITYRSGAEKIQLTFYVDSIAAMG